MNSIELQELIKIYKLNYKWGIFYKQLVLTSKKDIEKELYKTLICQKKSFHSILSTYIEKRIKKEDFEKLQFEAKSELKKLNRKFHPELNTKNSLLCCEVEKRLFEIYCESLRKVTDGKVREILLSHKHRLADTLHETEKVRKNLI